MLLGKSVTRKTTWSIRWTVNGFAKEASPLIQVAPLQRQALVLEDRHGGAHAHEAQLLVEVFLAGYRVENDLLVAVRQLQEPLHDLPSEAQALMAWQQGHVADVRAIRAIGQRAAH